MDDGTKEFLLTAVAHKFLGKDSADRLATEAKLQDLTPQSFAIKSGVLNSWQVETLKVLCKPSDHVPGFYIDAVLGRGGFGTVYKATQVNLDRHVALKTIPLSSLRDDTATKRFEREAKIIGSMSHPNIVGAHDFGFHDDLLFLSLELVDGKDLSKFIGKRGRIDEFTTWQMLKQVASALAYAEGLNVTHRDIKPGNLMLTATPAGYPLPQNVPFVKVTDFGLACFSHDIPGENTITMAGTGLGTPSYVAPEQLTGDKVDQRADIYAIGATAFHMLSGKPAYHEVSPAKVMGIKTTGKEVWVDRLVGKISPASIELMRNMTAYDPEDRIPDHRELIRNLDSVLESLRTESSSTQSTYIGEIDDQFDSPGDFVVALDDSVESGLDSAGDSSIEPSNKFKPKSFTKIMFVVGASIALLLATILFWIYRPALASIVDEIELNADGRVVQIYNGFKLNNSAFIVRGGQWQKFEDSEGGRVMLGSNCRVIFPCQTMSGDAFKYLRYSVGLQVNEAATVSFTAGDEMNEKIFSVVFSQLGYFLDHNNRKSELIEWNVHPAEQNGYINLELTRNNANWTVMVDRKVIGKVRHTGLTPATIVMESRKGNSLFENPNIVEMLTVSEDLSAVE